MSDNNYLKNLNYHERDNDTSLDEEKHIYNIQGDTNYISMTTFIHSLFENFDSDKIITNMMKSKNWSSNKYYGLTREQIKKQWEDNKNDSSSLGTLLHLNIEEFYNKKIISNNSKEWIYFINFHNFTKDFLKPYRTEWIVYDKELKIAGSIDMTFQPINIQNKDDKKIIDIYDWKRCKDITKISKYNKWSTNYLISHIPDSNYWHYAFQLNGYKWILEKNYNLLVRDLYLVWLHPDNSNYKLIKLPNLQNEIELLFEQRRINLI